MNWLKWILAYLFDCVHPHTTWPHRDRAGFVYICCLDCGRELPYSLQRMSIVTNEELADRGAVREQNLSNFEEGKYVSVQYAFRAVLCNDLTIGATLILHALGVKWDRSLPDVSRHSRRAAESSLLSAKR